jgi:hypothetical protein
VTAARDRDQQIDNDKHNQGNALHPLPLIILENK